LALQAWGNLAVAAEQDWPQWRGPNRDGVALNSPRLLDTWPKDGPPLLWKSEWLPGCEEGGCGDPVVADGKVFVYANAKIPNGGGDSYRAITTNLLALAGWNAGLPDALARRIEAAWAATNRPSSAGWKWYDSDTVYKPGALNAFLAQKPELAQYIRDFLATLAPEDVQRHGDYIRRRLCMDLGKPRWGVPNSPSWETLVKLSSMTNVGHRSRREWAAALDKVAPGTGSLIDCFPIYPFWYGVFSMADSIFCLDAASGRTLWRQDFPEPWSVATANSNRVQWWCFDSIGACAAPAVVDGRCYVSGAMGLYCLSAANGARLWQVPGEPVHSQVLVVDGVVYDGGRGRACDAATGKILWTHPRWPQGRWPVKDDQYRWCPPLLWRHDGSTYLIATDGGVSGYACLEPRTGRERWFLQTPVALFNTLRGDILVTSAPYGAGGTRAYRLTPTGAEPLWKAGFGCTDGQLLDGPRLHALDRCVDLRSGEIHWRSALGIDSVAPPLLVDGKIIAQWGSSHQITKQWGGGYQVVMFRATPEAYVELGRFNPHACHMCSPAVADGRLYVRLLDSLACYDLQEHGIYLDRVDATRDTLTFRFAQTGGGLAEDAPAGLRLLDADGLATPAAAHVQGDALVVDIHDAPVPFRLSCTNSTGKGRNGKPLPPFTWSLPRALRLRSCLDHAIVLASDRPLVPEGKWDAAATYTVAGAAVTNVLVDPSLRSVQLITDRAWKPGDKVDLSYAVFPATAGEARRATLAFTVTPPVRPAARFIRKDTLTSGNWKGLYGAEGAVICGNRQAPAPAGVQVSAPPDGSSMWAASATEPRYLQLAGTSEGRSIRNWASGDQFDIGIDITDGREHQVAAYCLDWGRKTELRVDVLDADTKVVLDTQSVQGHANGHYLVWNIQGQVILRFSTTVQLEGTTAVVGGVFFDPAK
jgi:outer membrane protein assembly factor BamB